MPDDPLSEGAGGAPDPKERLKKLIDDIEADHAPKSDAMPDVPSDDEIRSGLYTSPIESQLNKDRLGPEERLPEGEELSEEERQLREFDEKLKAARSRAMPEPPEWDYRRPNSGQKNKAEENNYLGMGVGISVAYTMVGCTLVGWGIGKLIDMRGGGYIGQAIGTLCGAVVGLIGAIFTIIQAQNKQG